MHVRGHLHARFIALYANCELIEAIRVVNRLQSEQVVERRVHDDASLHPLPIVGHTQHRLPTCVCVCVCECVCVYVYVHVPHVYYV